ncbi:peptidylprolyl isomerase [Microbulbifer yueqingensis]|uniref:Peptidyl-prolyl cis-trans isomerase n=1 Tax=Microbulbifer yueqingensis TaxID=658219 RepID=A0A1G8UXN7_9GAMM|nr:peptidylprolyl isomerase [Microbulbifer yueqingensis]SDJ58626.1 peptidyl-prolyl cis-trans isomerase A (cyclophilin A) [Microbulbifer yueqingensis]
MLIRKVAAALFAGLLAVGAHAGENRPQVELKTDLGTVRIELYADRAPATVENFLQYVDSGFYDGVIFHRVIPGFMAQTGGHTFDFQEKETREPVVNESDNGLQNVRGTLAMARTEEPDSATSQFYINYGDNRRLDGSADKPGYTVFGRVIDGMEVVDRIGEEPRGLYRAFPDAPNTPVRILEARRVEAGEVASKEEE